jgi:hypothetical protein
MRISWGDRGEFQGDRSLVSYELKYSSEKDFGIIFVMSFYRVYRGTFTIADELRILICCITLDD